MARLQLLGLIIDQSALSKLENGQRPIADIIADIEVVALAEALRVPVAWLFEEIESLKELR